MYPTTVNALRQAYLDFFTTKHNHAVIAGASLVPENDPTVLFTTAGMHPLVPYLSGQVHPAGTRLVDVQRCVRTGDIEEVGDSTHLTMFEMLGNWGLGDYFKEEAINMSYEFLTQVLEIEPTMLSVTCFEGDANAPKDEEAAEIWQQMGMKPEQIGFLGKKDNWWGPAGKTGPCGPDTEMFYWVGEGAPHGNPSINEDDWMEIWNDVFMQYNKQEDGSFEPLAMQNVDTGMGLERIAAVMQARAKGINPKDINVYQIDSMQPIYNAVEQLATEKTHPAFVQRCRIITDHIKAAVFMIGDGIRPGNTDQAYVLRRLIRRAIRAAKQNGSSTTGEFCTSIAKVVLQQNGDFYSHLTAQENVILEALSAEEIQFNSTLSTGLKQFEKIADSTTDCINGTDAFHLYDTFGFPLEMTLELAKERSLTVDEVGFSKAFTTHQATSRAGAEQKFSGGLADHSAETTKLHTATHLLNAALRQVLGDHISQKGSNITVERLRFDFNHEQKMTVEEKQEVERLVNEAIAQHSPISYHLTTPDEAKEEGAIGVFDDKYDAQVKVYTIGDPSSGSGQVFSKEICGGPHVANTSMIGTFTLKKEESSSAGVRRIKATISGGPDEIEYAAESAQ